MKNTLTCASIKATVLRFVLLAIFSVTMTGCATTAVTAVSQQEASARAIYMREVRLNQSWRGRSLDELMKEFGEPMVFLKPIDPFLENTTVAVFDATKTASSCYDTFTVVARNGKWHVQEYVCT